MSRTSAVAVLAAVLMSACMPPEGTGGRCPAGGCAPDGGAAGAADAPGTTADAPGTTTDATGPTGDPDVAPPVPWDPALPPLPATCDEAPAPGHASGGTVTLAIQPTLGGAPVELGVPATSGNRRFRLSNVRMFVGHPVLLRAGRPGVLADLIDARGKPLPYGVQLVDLDDPATLSLRLRAPAGSYDGLAVAIGLSPACNTGNPAAKMFPLNAGGGMTWIWTFGYVFVLIEGTVDVSGTAGDFAAHGGAFPPTAGPVVVRATGRLQIPGTAPVVLGARLDDLAEAALEGNGHLEAGITVMARLPRAQFLSLP